MKTIAITGNPNVGKSTVFNGLTGLRQHTGNWPGKTVVSAQGVFFYKGEKFNLVDLPGTYSLTPCSQEEEVTRDFLCFGKIDATIIVADATNLKRNLGFVLSVIEISKNPILCLNLVDQAKIQNIHINIKKLQNFLNIPVVPTNARKSQGFDRLIKMVKKSIEKKGCFKRKFDLPDFADIVINRLKPLFLQELGKEKQDINLDWICLEVFEQNKTLENPLREKFNLDINKKSVLSEIEKIKKELFFLGVDFEDFKDERILKRNQISDEIYDFCVIKKNGAYQKRDNKIDKILTSKLMGIPVMLCLLFFIFWLTITGSNYPSQILSKLLFGFGEILSDFFRKINSPDWLHGILILGVYRTLAWVVSVMFPPMAIFFPLFTILEDLGYLPRVAFNLDNFFRKVGAHGKQALTMCMGFGCNACGITGCRIIDSRREKLIAMLTNNFVPCNGRFPILISIITMFFIGTETLFISFWIPSLILALIIVFGIFMTFLCSKILTKTILKGEPSNFILELPPYRKPQFCKVFIRSLFDRTVFILLRAMAVAAPAGLVIWLIANVNIAGKSLLYILSSFFDPFAKSLGLDGTIFIAFLLGFPANEIVMPIIIMSYLCKDNLVSIDSLADLHNLLVSNGWTWITAICTMIFSLMHFPCGTTCLTIKKESKSLKWTVFAFVLPTVCGIVTCYVIASLAKIFNLF